MSKIVIAGSANCPYYARIELLADSLTKNLPDFKVHKIVKQPNEWESWLSSTCKQRGWVHKKSPMVWRELIDRGGKGNLIGGANEFQEYAHGYYGVKSSFISDDMTKIATENLKTKDEIDKEEKEFQALSTPLKVCITNASSPVCYSMIHSLALGDVLGKDTEISMCLYDNADMMEYVHGAEMEACDLACPLLRNIEVTSDMKQAFSNCSAIIILDELLESDEETKEDWIKRNNEHFVKYAQVIASEANSDVKVVVGGNGPVNFNVSMMLKSTPTIPRQNIVASPRMVENNAKAIVAERLDVNSAGVVDIIIWGSANSEHFVDLSHARVHGYDGAVWGPPSFSVPAKEMVHDEKWLAGEFLDMLSKRQQVTQEALNHRPAVSQAAAISSLLGHWWQGSNEGQMFSLAVCSEGWYGVPEGLVFSFPVSFSSPGTFTVVQGIDQDADVKDRLQAAIQDLQSEEAVIYPPPYQAPPTPPTTATLPSEENINNSASGETSDPDDLAGLGKIREDKEGEARAEKEVSPKLSDEGEGAEEVKSRSSSQASEQ